MTKGTENTESITMFSSIMGSDFHSDNHQTESTNSNVPNTQFTMIKNTIIKTTDCTIVSYKTTNTAQLASSKTESIISTTASRGPTIQSSIGDSNTTTLIAAVISTVLILLVVSILVIIIVSVLMYKRRKRLTLKISSRGDGNHATSTMRKDEEEMSNNPSYQSQGTYTYKYYQHYSYTVTLHERPINSTITDNPSYGVNKRRNQGSKLIYCLFH